jgi:hypothetical protein
MNLWYSPGEAVLVDGIEAEVVEKLSDELGSYIAYKVKLKHGEYLTTTAAHMIPMMPTFCRPGCECGVGILGSGKHSSWCPQSRFEQ